MTVSRMMPLLVVIASILPAAAVSMKRNQCFKEHQACNRRLERVVASLHGNWADVEEMAQGRSQQDDVGAGEAGVHLSKALELALENSRAKDRQIRAKDRQIRALELALEDRRTNDKQILALEAEVARLTKGPHVTAPPSLQPSSINLHRLLAPEGPAAHPPNAHTGEVASTQRIAASLGEAGVGVTPKVQELIARIVVQELNNVGCSGMPPTNQPAAPAFVSTIKNEQVRMHVFSSQSVSGSSSFLQEETETSLLSSYFRRTVPKNVADKAEKCTELQGRWCMGGPSCICNCAWSW